MLKAFNTKNIQFFYIKPDLYTCRIDSSPVPNSRTSIFKSTSMCVKIAHDIVWKSWFLFVT